GEQGKQGKLRELGEQGYIFPEQGDAILRKDATPFPGTLSTVHTPQSIDGSGFPGCAVSPR
ncbi:MAG: hypothetical protein RID53_29895, partial [Coleofasciculus sp. B1-GNL1-01]|uniref:hypothetical protein n=1 Tax=Coleofasciculus sp. B1-GNL1-01 TaxID=3068484 RepID=UPI0032FB4F8C